MSTAAESARTVARPVSPGRPHAAEPDRPRSCAKLPFWILIALIFIYALFPFYWALRSAFTPEAQLFDTPIQYFPHHPTLQNFRDVLSSDFFRRALLNSTIVAGSVTLISLAIGSLAAYALGRFRFRGRSLDPLPDALDDDLPADRDPRRPLHDDQRLPRRRPDRLPEAVRHGVGADLQLPDLHAPVHDLGADELHARTAGRPRGGGLRRRRDAAAGLLQGAAAADRARARDDRACSPSSRPGTSTSSRSRSSSRPTTTRCRSRSRRSSGKSGNAFQTPWGEIMAATVVVTVPLIAATLLLQKTDPGGPDRRRRQGLDRRTRLAGRRSRAGSCRRRARSRCPRRSATSG